jgi:hypothetical protein
VLRLLIFSHFFSSLSCIIVTVAALVTVSAASAHNTVLLIRRIYFYVIFHYAAYIFTLYFIHLAWSILVRSIADAQPSVSFIHQNLLSCISSPIPPERHDSDLATVRSDSPQRAYKSPLHGTCCNLTHDVTHHTAHTGQLPAECTCSHT